MKIDSIRKEYKYASLTKKKVFKNPFDQFEKWMDEALKTEMPYPTAMSFTSVGCDGFPASRIVLLKHYDENGFVFFTNYNSDKARSAEKDPAAGLHFFWPELERQIRITGYTGKTPTNVSDEYFRTRPEKSQIAAWASAQSTEIPSRKYLEKEFTKFNEKFLNEEIPRPDFWGGLIVKPVKIEFWQGRESRLHDRILYEKESDNWKIKRLAP